LRILKNFQVLEFVCHVSIADIINILLLVVFRD